DATSALTVIPTQVGEYVANYFGSLTGCLSPATATDDCATAYLAALAERAYRRPLTADELNDIIGRYNDARATTTVVQATKVVVAAIVVAPQFLNRSEQGDPTHAATSPAVITL